MDLKKKDKVLVSFSGGLDSTVALAWAIHNDLQPVCVNFNYGQNNWVKENRAANKIIEFYNEFLMYYNKENIELRSINLSPHYTNVPNKATIFSTNNSLRNQTVEVPKGKADKTNINDIYVPGRNLVFASLLACIAEAESIRCVIMGILKTEHFNDCKPNFLYFLQETIKESSGGKVNIEFPLFSIDSTDNKRLLASMVKTYNKGKSEKVHVPVELSWSCYTDEEEQCGDCHACLGRLRFFDELNNNNVIELNRVT